MTLIFPMSISVQAKYYTFAEYELTEKIMGVLLESFFLASFSAERRAHR